MQAIHISLLLHFVGIGLVFTTLIAGWLLHAQYLKAPDYRSKREILMVLRPIGLLSPFSTLLLMASGLTNMVLLHYDPTTALWLSIKLLLFVAAALAGIFFGARSSRRSRLVSLLAEGNAPAGTEANVAALDKQQRVFFLFQGAVLFVILGLSIIKPKF